MVAPSKDYKVIGTRPVRPDGTDKVTGRAQYGADVRLTGMLFGRVLRSPHAHANIKSIDASKALALPGVINPVRFELEHLNHLEHLEPPGFLALDWRCDYADFSKCCQSLRCCQSPPHVQPRLLNAVTTAPCSMTAPSCCGL